MIAILHDTNSVSGNILSKSVFFCTVVVTFTQQNSGNSKRKKLSLTTEGKAKYMTRESGEGTRGRRNDKKKVRKKSSLRARVLPRALI